MNNRENKHKILIKGIVDKVLTVTSVIVTLENKTVISCQLSKKIKKYNLNIFPGDTVDVEISPYDLKKGTIVHRYKQ